VLTRAQAEEFAVEWVAAWNSHDLARILSHYSDDFVMSSPRIAVVAGEPSGVLSGKAAVARYWEAALALSPNLHFELESIYLGTDSMAIQYKGMRGPAIEVFFFNQAGLVSKAAAHYL